MDQGGIEWGHANLAAEWLSEKFLSGTGTVDDPVHSTAVTAQCSVYSREALLFGGYFDPRFTGYGHEHVEHSCRLIRCGYGGGEKLMPNGEMGTYFLMLRGGIRFLSMAKTFFDQDQVDCNLTLCHDTGAGSPPVPQNENC